MVTICVGDGFEVDTEGRLVLDLRSGCNALSVTPDGVGVMGVDRFDQVPRFGASDYAEATGSASGPYTTSGSTTHVGIGAAVDTVITNPSDCRDMMWMAWHGHYADWFGGSAGAGRFLLSNLLYINGVLSATAAGEHGIDTGQGGAVLTVSIPEGPFFLDPGESVTVSTQPAWRATGAVTNATISNLTYSIRTVGFFV